MIMPGPLDNTLASNVATGLLLPRLDQAIGHGAKYLLQQLGATAAEGLAALGRRSPTPDLAPRALRQPGNAAPMTAASHEATVRNRMETLTCAETGREHPVLPRDRCAAMASYMAAVNTAALPVSIALPDGQQDGFTARVETTEGPVDLLPTSLTTSVLLNRKLRAQIADHEARIATQERNIDYLSQRIAALEGTLPTLRGRVQPHYTNTLYDPLTGFAASIALREDREVVVNFSGVGSQGAGIRQFLRCAANILGLTPPKNFSQASQLTQIVKARLEDLNAKLPPGEPKYRLKLAGHSMGGGMATYAALRNDVEAVVFNPLRLGLMTRAKVGRPALKNAPKLVTEVVVKTDWVADNSRSRLYGLLHLPSVLLTGRRADAWGAIGTRYLLPKPSTAQLERHALEANYFSRLGAQERADRIRKWTGNFDVHSEVVDVLRVHARSPAPSLEAAPAARPEASDPQLESAAARPGSTAARPERPAAAGAVAPREVPAQPEAATRPPPDAPPELLVQSGPRRGRLLG